MFAKGVRKKRGRKEDLRSRKAAAHGFRVLSGYRIPDGFEHGLTKIKTENRIFMNKGNTA